MKYIALLCVLAVAAQAGQVPVETTQVGTQSFIPNQAKAASAIPQKAEQQSQPAQEQGAKVVTSPSAVSSKAPLIPQKAAKEQSLPNQVIPSQSEPEVKSVTPNQVLPDKTPAVPNQVIPQQTEQLPTFTKKAVTPKEVTPQSSNEQSQTSSEEQQTQPQQEEGKEVSREMNQQMYGRFPIRRYGYGTPNRRFGAYGHPFYGGMRSLGRGPYNYGPGYGGIPYGIGFPYDNDCDDYYGY